MPRVDLLHVRQMARDTVELHNWLKDFFENKCSPDDPPYLSDLIVSLNRGGVYIMEELARLAADEIEAPSDMRFMWHLQVLRNEFGNLPDGEKPYPGDIIYRRITKPLQHDVGKPVTSDELNQDIANGEYEKKWVKKVPFKVDSKGCISTPFSATSHFLTVFGVHGKSGHPISIDGHGPIHKVEHSDTPGKMPNGDFKYVWYRRFREVDKQEYDQLPEITRNVEKKKGL